MQKYLEANNPPGFSFTLAWQQAEETAAAEPAACTTTHPPTETPRRFVPRPEATASASEPAASTTAHPPTETPRRVMCSLPRGYGSGIEPPQFNGEGHCPHCFMAPCVVQRPPDFLVGAAPAHLVRKREKTALNDPREVIPACAIQVKKCYHQFNLHPHHHHHHPLCPHPATLHPHSLPRPCPHQEVLCRRRFVEHT